MFFQVMPASPHRRGMIQRSAMPLGFGLKASKPGIATEPQDASPRLQITTTRARLLAAKCTVAISIAYPATRP
jgi:hypothetical protein